MLDTASQEHDTVRKHVRDLRMHGAASPESNCTGERRKQAERNKNVIAIDVRCLHEKLNIAVGFKYLTLVPCLGQH